MDNHIICKGLDERRQRLETEFYEGLDPRLRGILLDQGLWLFNLTGKPLRITCIYRSPVENKDVEGLSRSAHMDWRAVDAGSREFAVEHKDQYISRLQHLYEAGYLYVLHHDSGHGEHFHHNIRYLHRLTDKDRVLYGA